MSLKHNLRFIEREVPCGTEPDIAKRVRFLQFYDNVLDDNGNAPGWTDVGPEEFASYDPLENTRTFQKVEDTGLSLLPTVSSLATNILRQLSKISTMLEVGNNRDGQIMDCVSNAADHATRIQKECLRDG